MPEMFLKNLDIITDSQGWQGSPNPNDNQGIGLILVRNISTLLGIVFSTEVSAGMVTAMLTFNELKNPVI